MTAEQLYEEGLEAIRQGDHDQALNSFAAAVQADGRAEYFAALGNVYSLKGDPENALFYLKQACERDTASSEHRSDLAGILFEKGMHRDAIHFYQEAVEADPTNAEHFYRLGCAFFYQAEPNYERARAALRQAVALYPTSEPYQRTLGLACYRLGEFAEAVDALRAAAHLGAAPSIHYNLAAALFAQGAFEEAAEAASQALDENEEEWDPRVVRLHALALHRCQKWPEALEALSLASRLHPEDVRLFELQGDVLNQMGGYEKAGRAYQKAAMLAPDRAELHYHMGTAFMQALKGDKAIAPLRKALELKPDYGDAWNNLALAYDLQGQREPALEAVGRALALNPDKPEYQATKARLS